jgi:hypothetical protein
MSSAVSRQPADFDVSVSSSLSSWLACFALDPGLAGSYPDDGDRFLGAIEFLITTSLKTGSKAVDPMS